MCQVEHEHLTLWSIKLQLLFVPLWLVLLLGASGGLLELCTRGRAFKIVGFLTQLPRSFE